MLLPSILSNFLYLNNLLWEFETFTPLVIAGGAGGWYFGDINDGIHARIDNFGNRSDKVFENNEKIGGSGKSPWERKGFDLLFGRLASQGRTFEHFYTTIF